MQSRAKVWPQNLAPAAGSFGGQTIYPNKAAHPGRFEQRLQQQTGSTVNSQQQQQQQKQQPTAFVQRTSIADSNSLPHVASSSGTIQPPSVSLASLAAQEWSRQRKEQLLNSGCVESNALVSLNSNLANRANKQNVRSAASLDSALEYSILLPSLSTATLVSHHLATGQLSSWEQALQDEVLGDPGRLDALILESPVNPFPLPGQDYYSIGVSELYNITCERQPIYLSSNAPPLIMPLTLARIVQIAAFEMPLKQKQMCSAAYAGGQEEPLPVYWFKTAAPHGYVPGLTFFFMAAPPAVPVQCPPECCDQYNPFEPKNTDRFVVIDTAHCQDALLHGGEQECCFLALRCRSESQCLSAQQARIFAPFDDIEFKKYGCEEPLLVLKDLDFQVSEQLSSLSEESTQSTSCLHYACSSTNAFAYVPPPTSPEQLAALVNGTLRRSALVCVNVRCEPLFDASVAYDPLIDQFRIDFGSSCSYVRSLFGDACNVATTLNFPLTRSMMVVSETSANAQQVYLNRVLHDFFWFKIETDVNDSFQVYFECGNQTLKRTVTIPAGVYVASQFASVLQTTLNNAYVSDAENKKSYQFRVEQKLYATEQLARARAEWATTQSAALLPLAVSTPYTSKTFCFFIEASDSLQLFSLDFSQTEQSRAFARLIDFDPDFCYQLKSSYVGRALAPFYYGSESGARNLRQCLDQIEKCALVCSPCPRRTYSARVFDDQAQKTVALEQRIQRPFQVCKSAWDECSGTMAVKIVDADVNKCSPPIQICAGDVLVASRTNPLCRLCSGDTTEQCTLVPVIDVCSPNEFILAFDPLPAPLLTLNQTDNEEQCAERLQTIDTIWLWSMPVGFNLHLHPATPLQQASSVIYADSNQSRLVPQASQSNPVTRYLGFSTPRTRSGAYLYTSDTAPISVIDENILLVVPELVPAASSENRHTMYANTSAFDRLLTQVYAQLTLDTQLNQYVAYPDRTGAQLSLCRDLCIGACTTGITPLASMTVILQRPDGSPYYLNGGQYVLTFEMGFWQQ